MVVFSVFGILHHMLEIIRIIDESSKEDEFNGGFRRRLGKKNGEMKQYRHRNKEDDNDSDSDSDDEEERESYTMGGPPNNYQSSTRNKM